MSMHLVHPSLTTTGKRKGKPKWASAEQKRQHEALEREWQNKLQEYRQLSKPVKVKPVKSAAQLAPRIPPGRDTTRNIPSVDLALKGAVASPQPQQYTGDKVLGITIVHKSCLQPVFSQEAAIDAARMRRG